MTTSERVILFSAPDDGAAVEVFLSPDGSRLEAVVLYASDRVKLLRFPESARPRADAIEGDATTPGEPTCSVELTAGELATWSGGGATVG